MDSDVRSGGGVPAPAAGAEGSRALHPEGEERAAETTQGVHEHAHNLSLESRPSRRSSSTIPPPPPPHRVVILKSWKEVLDESIKASVHESLLLKHVQKEWKELQKQINGGSY